MDPLNYYITTLTNAFTKLGPLFIFIFGGYLLFIKLPFLFLRKSMHEQKKKLEEENHVRGKNSVDDSLEFQRKLKLVNPVDGKGDTRKNSRPEMNQEEKKQNSRDQKASSQQGSRQGTGSRKEGKQPEDLSQTPEAIFNFKADERFTKVELKKRYFELLRQNHPDRVASMGEDFKKLAEKNTKEINKAYEKLKNKAS